jgi:SAM-dependent MidA family methyltransferase
MNESLYSDNGYYAKFRTIGKEGDFYTAVSSSMFFGGSIANRFISTIEEGVLPEDTTIVEIGAHQGYMLADIVQFIYTLKRELLESVKFVIIEPHAENIEAQLKYFKESFGDLVELQHFSSLDELELESAFVVANELFDAFSCELVEGDNMIYMEDHKPIFKEQTKQIKEHCKKYGVQKGEVSIGFEEFAKSMSDSIKRYEFVTFDYGDKEKREDFSIRYYYKHQTYPFFAMSDFIKNESERVTQISYEELFKKSDLTYDVHFEHLMDAYESSGAKVEIFKTQLAILVEFGITELLEMLKQKAGEEAYLAEVNRAKVLLNPTFMGERFKGIVFRKDGL